MGTAVAAATSTIREEAAQSHYELTAPANRRTPLLARRFVAGALEATGHLGLSDDACVCVSDVVTNVVQHAGVRSLRIELTAHTNGVVVAVCDDNIRRLPWPRQARDDEESGRGLALVQEIAHASGVSGIWDELQLMGKRVWFELREEREGWVEGATE
ncbi:ATP-binding protein [Streptomyces orinoci]|uniref:ATP-binding protein n=1 Tax=Streptomyces orinoci TaxID=67339 RepID=A0ABV3JYZ0_STRON|nr:ATP-binding protein [Streptomyces orinoci]